MQNRRDFLKTAALAAAGATVGLPSLFAANNYMTPANINKLGKGAKMKMPFFPYELPFHHVFTVSTSSRHPTPSVPVEIASAGVFFYVDSSMPPYLG